MWKKIKDKMSDQPESPSDLLGFVENRSNEGRTPSIYNSWKFPNTETHEFPNYVLSSTPGINETRPKLRNTIMIFHNSKEEEKSHMLS